jgi:hypothetical protein
MSDDHTGPLELGLGSTRRRRSPRLGWREEGERRPSMFRFRRDSVIPGRADETISIRREVLRKQRPPTLWFNQTTGLDHVGIGIQPHLPRVPQAGPSRHVIPGRKAMTEIVAAFLIFASIGVFLAHAFDAYRLR